MSARSRSRAMITAAAAGVANCRGRWSATEPRCAPAASTSTRDSNVGAGETLFNGTYTGYENVGLGRAVMPHTTTGFRNVAVGDDSALG